MKCFVMKLDVVNYIHIHKNKLKKTPNKIFQDFLKKLTKLMVEYNLITK